MATRTTRRKVRLGIIGGVFARQFQWHLHPDCVVGAVASRTPAHRAGLMETYRCATAYRSLDELIADPNLDAVAIFTEGPRHAEHAVAALQHGKHVISAVPACWGSLEEAERLLEAVTTSGLTYMMAETSYYQQVTISARRFYRDGAFGELYYCESEYLHPGFEHRGFDDGKPNWRCGMVPMHYPTHCTAHLVGVTGERLTEVSCLGWGDDSPILKENPYANPFWNESATFKTDRGHAFRVNVWWKGACQGTERAKWIGTKFSLHAEHPHGLTPTLVRTDEKLEQDDAGFDRLAVRVEPYDQPAWWQTDMLPEPLRIATGHDGSHAFLTHEFVRALVEDRRPAIDIYEALAYTVPGILAHESALQGGALLKIPQYDPPKSVHASFMKGPTSRHVGDLSTPQARRNCPS